MMDRKGFIASVLAIPIAADGVFGDAVKETHELTVGPNDVLCFVADPAHPLTHEAVRRLRESLNSMAEKWGMDASRIVVTQGLTPYVMKGP